MSTERPVIAIDGPAGAGKSTVAGLLSKMLGIPVLDTGGMYRAVALAASRAGLGADRLDEVATLGGTVEITFGEGSPRPILLDSEDVSAAIRTLEIGQLASEISVHPPVRRLLVRQQQNIVSGGGWVLEGRDVTTVVAPNADLKIFLTASIEERARRRWLEMLAKGGTQSLQEVVVDVVQRDHRDYSRADSPLTLAEDAHIVESFGLTPEQVAEKIVALLPR